MHRNSRSTFQTRAQDDQSSLRVHLPPLQGLCLLMAPKKSPVPKGTSLAILYIYMYLYLSMYKYVYRSQSKDMSYSRNYLYTNASPFNEEPILESLNNTVIRSFDHGSYGNPCEAKKRMILVCRGPLGVA